MVTVWRSTLSIPPSNVFCASHSPRCIPGRWIESDRKRSRPRWLKPAWDVAAASPGPPGLQAAQQAPAMPPSATTHHPAPALSNDASLLQGCEPGPRLRVAALLSGGVDSSVALALTQRAGHEVHAFYLQIWFQEDFRNTWASCPWEEDLEQCREVCRALGDIPLHVVPLTAEYWALVVEECIAGVRRGRTPNPDMLCNSRVKFGAFHAWLARQEPAFDRIASGHYARVERGGAGGTGEATPHLATSPDAVKDQTYFLSRLSGEQLARCMFPLGHLQKTQVRQLAAELQLPNAARRESQGLCFLGHVRFDEFIREHLGDWPGPIVEEESDTVLGYHRGFWFHTLGQRKGVPLHGGPWYVTRKDIELNIVYVSRAYHEAPRPDRSTFRVSQLQWHRRPEAANPDAALQLRCKARHGPDSVACTLEMADADSASGVVTLATPDQGLAPGQFAVFYKDEICCGSGVIEGGL
uniref:tRNA-5-taurinomethyluridine 2-sulfurtransferase n=2 Tax=Auxenochlorella protothecoides TaxID=3075 RepID=A0A1D2A8T4_AUXPR